jgi:hypothetical protein
VRNEKAASSEFISVLINTQLQLGVRQRTGTKPFQRFSRVRKTAEAVAAILWLFNTPLKQGVNQSSPF